MDGELKISIDAPAAAGSRSIYRATGPVARFLREDLELLREPSYYIVLAASVAMQYVHGVAGQAALYMHKPAPALHDVGFDLIPALGPAMWWFSEAITIMLFTSFGAFLVVSIGAKRQHCSITILRRALATVSSCQLLRILSFTATQLPAPSQHCQPGNATALERPNSVWDFLKVDVKRQASQGCGDLVFSSHVTFGLVFALSMWHYSRDRRLHLAMAVLVALQCYGILASRKHYTLDVVVALYAVPLVWDVLLRRLPDPSNGVTGR